MKITAKQSFVHGPTHYRRGDVLDVSDATGSALIKAGLAESGEQKQAAPAAKKTAKRAAKKSTTKKTDAAVDESVTQDADTGAGTSEADNSAGNQDGADT